MENLGFMTVVPLLVLIALVIITKRIVPSMIVALVIVFIMRDGAGFFLGFTDTFYYTLSPEGTYSWILLMLVLYGAFIEILLRSGGITGFKRIALKRIQTEKGSKIFTWFFGLAMFIDEYINGLTIGPSVRSITDKYNIPREHIGYIIVAMGLPVCAFVPITVLAVFVFGLMQDNGLLAPDTSMVSGMMNIIPYMIYPAAMVIISLLFAIGIMPKLGAMKKTQPMIACSDNNTSIDGENSFSSKEGSLIDFILPVATLIGVMAYTSDSVMSVSSALFMAFILAVFRRKMTIDEYFESFFKGIMDMTETLIVILLAFIMVSGLNDIGINEYIAETITPYLNGSIIPALTFLVVAIITFLGIDYWASMLLMTPIALQMSEAFGIDPFVTMGAIVSGAIAGATTCYFGEQMLMCAQSVEKKAIQLGPCVLPYGIIAIVISIIAFLILGFVA